MKSRIPSLIEISISYLHSFDNLKAFIYSRLTGSLIYIFLNQLPQEPRHSVHTLLCCLLYTSNFCLPIKHLKPKFSYCNWIQYLNKTMALHNDNILATHTVYSWNLYSISLFARNIFTTLRTTETQRTM